MNRKNKRPLSPRDSRAIRRSLISPLKVKPSRAFFAKQAPFGRKTVRTAVRTHRKVRSAVRSRSLNLNVFQPMIDMQRIEKRCSSVSKVLSWRADQKLTGKGGRKRAPRSQREKAASAAKLQKLCK